jgi:hypothetical protein
VIVMELPRAAASSSSPMMLLPSISRPARATRMRAAKRPAACTNFAAARACRPRSLTIGTVHVVTATPSRL